MPTQAERSLRASVSPPADLRSDERKAIDAARDAAVARERERCAKIAENIYGGRAHTYASEDADVYRAQDDTCNKIAAAIRAVK